MAASTKRKIGRMACEGQRCKSHELKIPVVVFENDKGTLSYTCHECGRAPYARKGTDQHDEWLADIVPLDKPKEAEAPPGSPPQPAASVSPVELSQENSTAATPAAPAAAPAQKETKEGLSWMPK